MRCLQFPSTLHLYQTLYYKLPRGPNPNGKTQGGKKDTDAAHS